MTDGAPWGAPWLPEASTGLRDLSFAVVDLETTGGTPRAFWDRRERFHPPSEITEVGVVLLSGTLRVGDFSSLCAVERGIPPVIQRLTGITPDLLTPAPPWEQVVFRLAPALEGRIWVAHNAPFDGSFLKAYLPEGLWGRHRLLCTRRLAGAFLPEVRSRALASLCAHLGISNRRPHRALPDAEATAELLAHFLGLAENSGMEAEAFLHAGAIAWERL
ncbi:MAG: 3'-5' exonuclease [Acidobacteria bacterium]|nr:3'-5' exonuclease [Acidobacteriota bacterium]